MSDRDEEVYVRDMDPAVTRTQIGIGPLMTVGASNLYGSNKALKFDARIHPWLKDGKRAGRPRVMRVTIDLLADDLYRVRVGYLNRGEWVSHFEVQGIYAEDLARLIVDLDSGTEKGWL